MKIAKEDVWAYSFYTIFMAIVLAVALTGCASTQRFDNWFNTNTDSLKKTVHMTTAAFLYGHPDRAARVSAVCTTVRGKISAGKLTTASMVRAEIDAELEKLDLDPLDMVLMEDFIGGPEGLQQQIIDTFAILNFKNPAEQLVELDRVLGWVLEVSRVIK